MLLDGCRMLDINGVGWFMFDIKGVEWFMLDINYVILLFFIVKKKTMCNWYSTTNSLLCRTCLLNSRNTLNTELL